MACFQVQVLIPLSLSQCPRPWHLLPWAGHSNINCNQGSAEQADSQANLRETIPWLISPFFSSYVKVSTKIGHHISIPRCEKNYTFPAVDF